MKILQLVGMGAPKFGGFERYTLELAKQLSLRGDKMLVVFSKPPENKEYTGQLEQLENISWTVLTPVSVPKYITGLTKIIRSFKADIIHTNFARDGLLGLIAGRLCGLKTVHTAHGMPSEKGFSGWWRYKLRSISSHRYLAVSKEIAEKLRSYHGVKKTRLLYLGVPDFSYEKSECRRKHFMEIPEDRIIISCVAFHDPIKGVDILLDALDILKNRLGINNFTVAQIGGGGNREYTAFLKHRGTELGLDDNLIWMGIRNDVPELLAASDVYCQPSRSEGISLSIMEASVAGLPTVAFDEGGMPEVAREGVNAFLARPQDAEDLAEKLSSLVNDATLRKSMGAKAKEVAAESFCLPEQVGKLIVTYDSLFA